MTTADVADRAGVSVRTVARWARGGYLKPAFQSPGIRGPFLFSERDVDRFLAKNTEMVRRVAS